MFSPTNRSLTALTLLLVLISCYAFAARHAAARGRVAPHLPSGDVGAAAQVPAPTQEVARAARTLEPGARVLLEADAGGTHTFQVALKAGQFLRLVVEQQGADAAVRLLKPDGSLVVAKDSPNGMIGPELVSAVADADGNYMVEVRAGQFVPAGKFEVRVEDLRAPTAAALKRAQAELVFAQAQQLRAQATRESFKSAVAKYTEALQLWREGADVYGEAYTLINVGRSYRALGRDHLADSTRHLKEALALLAAARDVAGQAFVLNEIGASYRLLGDPLDAVKYYEEALDLRRLIGDTWGQAQALNNLGVTYANINRYAESVKNYKEALTLWPLVGDARNEANTQTGLADVYAARGELSLAHEQHRRVLDFSLRAADKRLEAYVRNNIGRIYDVWGEANTALDHYEEALRIFRELKSADGEALVLDNVGMVYAALGDSQGALDHFQQALALREHTKEPRGLAVTLTNIGYAYTIRGEPAEALKYLERALPLSTEANYKQFVAYDLLVTGMAHALLRQSPAALKHYDAALAVLDELEDPRLQAITLVKIGELRAAGGDATAAMSAYARALELCDAVGDRQGRAMALHAVAALESDRGNLEESRRRIDEAVEIIESLRIKTANQHLRLTYLASKHDSYALGIDVRMRLYEATGREAERVAALFMSERARARSLLDMLTEPRPDVRSGARPRDAERAVRLRRDINTQAEALLRLRSQKRAEDAKALERQLSALITEDNALQGRLRAAGRPGAGPGLQRAVELKEIQQLLDDDVLLLEFALGEKRSYVWAVTRTSLDSAQLPGRAEIEEAAASVRESITAYESPAQGESDSQYLARLNRAAGQYWSRASAISRMVLGPISRLIGSRRLVIVADGVLHYVPFHALPRPEPSAVTARRRVSPATVPPAPLVHSNEITYQPSASTLAALRKAPLRKHPRSVAVLADPVYDSRDERVTKVKSAATPPPPLTADLRRTLRDVGDIGETGEGLKLERLRHSAEEAAAIIAASAPGSWMKATDFQANRATATSPALAEFGIVHFATHGILNDKHPELSGVVLSLVDERGRPEDGFLRLHDIYDLNLPADLVVLSACRTGVGRQIKGEGLMGLTRGFIYAGARRVVASLWKVDDEATAELMKRFYRHMIEGRKRPADALRLAQIDVMRSSEQWSAPYYWAGFVLQGDWK